MGRFSGLRVGVAVGAVATWAACVPLGSSQPSLGLVASYEARNGSWLLNDCEVLLKDTDEQVLEKCGKPIGKIGWGNLHPKVAWCHIYRDLRQPPYAAVCITVVERFGVPPCFAGDTSPECKPKGTLTAEVRSLYHLPELPSALSLEGVPQAPPGSPDDRESLPPTPVRAPL